MSRPPIVTYVSVSFITATETPRISRTEIILTTVLPDITLSSFIVPGSLTSNHTQLTITSTTDTCCAISAATTLSTSYKMNTYSGHTSNTILSPSSSTSSSTTLTTVDNSANSPVPAAAPPAASTVSSVSTTTTISKAPGPSISLPGITGLSIALGIFFAALIGFFCYYRRKRKFHKEAMLLAPRFSQPTDQRSTGTGDKTLVSTSCIRGSLEKDINIWAVQPKIPAHETSPSVRSGAASFVRSAYMPRSSSLKSTAEISTEQLDSPAPGQEPPGSNSIYTVCYNPGGTLSFGYAAAEQQSHSVDTKSLQFNEALARLDAIHAASIRRELSPPPLRIVKRSNPNANGQSQSMVKPSPNLTPSSLEPISEADSPDSLPDRDKERKRAAALAKLEGRGARYTVGSVYSRGEDGTPFQKLEDEDSRPVWRNLRGLWPD